MDLRALADFVLVAESRGFAAAERRSGQPKATLSRRVRELEEELGARVFDRNSRALRLTDVGELLYTRARGPLCELAEAEVAIKDAGAQPRGLLRLSAPVLFSELALGRITASYLRANPKVQIDLVTEDRVALPIEEGFDLIIRVNPEPSADLVGRCIMRDRHQIVASPGLVEEISGQEGAVWPSILVKGRPEGPWRATNASGAVDVHHRPVLRTTSMITNYRAALDGAGIAKVPWFMVAADVEAGRLVRLGEDVETQVEVWALHPSRRLASRKLTSFLEHLIASFPDTRWPSNSGLGSW